MGCLKGIARSGKQHTNHTLPLPGAEHANNRSVCDTRHAVPAASIRSALYPHTQDKEIIGLGVGAAPVVEGAGAECGSLSELCSGDADEQFAHAGLVEFTKLCAADLICNTIRIQEQEIAPLERMHGCGERVVLNAMTAGEEGATDAVRTGF